MRIDEVRFAGYECIRMRTDFFELMATHSVGPRIIGFRRPSQPNVLVLLPETVIERPGGDSFRFIGGHRLWAAPEVPDITYAPDDASVDVTIAEGNVTLSAPLDVSGFEKTMTISAHDSGVSIVHELTNRGPARVAAPWAITQLVPRGTALLPLGGRDSDPYQANTNVVAWPYTDLADPLVRIEADRIEIEARRIDPIKFGTTLRRGWLAYRIGGDVFVKHAKTEVDARYPDLGASGQVYATRSFLELETLGPLQTLAEGATATHTETWELHDVDPSLPVSALADSLDLDR